MEGSNRKETYCEVHCVPTAVSAELTCLGTCSIQRGKATEDWMVSGKLPVHLRTESKGSLSYVTSKKILWKPAIMFAKILGAEKHSPSPDLFPAESWQRQDLRGNTVIVEQFSD